MKPKEKSYGKKVFSNARREYLWIFMLFFTFFLIFLLVSSLIYVQSTRKEREKLEQEAVEALSSSVEEWEQCVRQIYQQGYRMLNNEAFSQQIPGEKETGSRQSEKDLIDWMEIYGASVADYSSQVFLYYDDRYVFTPEGMSDFSMYFDVVRRHQVYPSESWEALLGSGQVFYEMKQDQVVEKYSGMSCETVLPVVISKKISGRQVVLGTEISADRILEMFRGRSTLEGQVILCMDEKGQVFFQNTDIVFTEEEKAGLTSRVEETPMLIESFTLGREGFLAIAKQGTMGMNFFLMTPKKQLWAETLRSSEFMLLFFLITMVLFFILTLIYTKRIYHPLRCVAQKLSLVYTSGEQEGKLDYSGKFQEAVDRFLVKNTSLLNQQEKLLQQSFDQAVRGLLRGEGCNERTLLEYLSGTGIDTDCMGCLILQTDFREKFYYDFTQEEQELIEENIPLIFSQILESGPEYCIVSDLEKRCICFFTFREEFEKNLEKMLEEVCLLFSGDRDYCDIHSGICARSSAGCRDVKRIVLEAATALRLQQESNICRPKEYDPGMANFGLIFSQKEKNQLQNFLSTGQEQRAIDLAGKILKANEEAGVYEGLIRILYFQLYQAGYEFLLSVGGENQEKAEHLWRQLLEARPRNHVGEKTLLKDFYAKCVELTRQEQMPDDILEKVFAYITEHFSEGIYLESAAEAAAVSPKYLSRIFKERTGVNISEYISLVRITKAKEMLISSTMSAGEIGELAGFENRSTFFRTFKKLEGVSPSEYRKAAGR